MKIIHTTDAPEAIGPYSQGVIAANLVFTSGQIAIDPATNRFLDGDIKAQTERVLKNISAILESAGTSMKNVILCNVYLKNLDDFAAFNDVYEKFFPENPPARVTVEVKNLPKDALVEISAVAER